MTDEERAALRRELITGPNDCLMNPQETAAFMGISEASLRNLPVPRADIAGPKYLKSQCLLYVKHHLSHQLLDIAS